MRRLTYLAIAIAFIEVIATSRTSSNAPPKPATGFPFINELLAGMSAYNLARDIVELSCAKSGLIDANIRKINCATPIASSITLHEAFELADRIIARSRNNISSRAFTDKALLKSIAKKYRFTVSTQPSPAEALAIYDFAINRILVKYLLQSLSRGTENGIIRSKELMQVGSQGIDIIDGYMQNTFQPTIMRTVERLRNENDATLLYIAIGCGSAEKDAYLITELRQRFPEMRVFPYCLDPYQSAKNHAIITLGGILDTTPLAEGETLISRAEKSLGNTPHISLVVGHYAFHHIGQSFPAFLENIGHAPLMLFETYTPQPWMLSSFQRSQKIGIDLLMNLGLDTIRDNHWIADAMQHPKQEIFQVYYLHEEVVNAYRDKADIAWVAPNKMVLSIIPKSTQSITENSANTK